ncbi:MAG: hypothetical protein ACM3JF_03410 [Sphaerimonospora mesophila]
MAKREVGYGNPINTRKAPGILSANDFSSSTTGRQPSSINESPIDGSVTLRVGRIYSMYRQAVSNILKENRATEASAKTEGNVFHLTANFPDVDSAELALAAIREITHRHHS